MRRTGISLALSALVLAGCSSEAAEQGAAERDVREQSPYEELAAVADTSEAYETGAADPVAAVQGGTRVGGPLTATGQFQGVNQNPPPGSVTLTEEGGGTRMSVLVTRYTANAALRINVVSGSCQSPGAVVHAVSQPVQTGEDGRANVNTVIPITTGQLLDGRHAITLTAGQGGGLVGCATLPAQASQQ